MAFIVGQKFRVMNNCPYEFYRGRIYVLESYSEQYGTLNTHGISSFDQVDVPLGFCSSYCEPIEDKLPDGSYRCKLCPAITTSSLGLCCDCKDVSK